MSNKRIRLLETDNSSKYKSFKLKKHLLEKGTDY